MARTPEEIKTAAELRAQAAQLLAQAQMLDPLEPGDPTIATPPPPPPPPRDPGEVVNDLFDAISAQLQRPTLLETLLTEWRNVTAVKPAAPLARGNGNA